MKEIYRWNPTACEHAKWKSGTRSRVHLILWSTFLLNANVAPPWRTKLPLSFNGGRNCILFSLSFSFLPSFKGKRGRARFLCNSTPRVLWKYRFHDRNATDINDWTYIFLKIQILPSLIYSDQIYIYNFEKSRILFIPLKKNSINVVKQ